MITQPEAKEMADAGKVRIDMALRSRQSMGGGQKQPVLRQGDAGRGLGFSLVFPVVSSPSPVVNLPV